MKDSLTQAQIHELLEYNSITGEFFWKVSVSNRKPAGSATGKPRKGNKYSTIMINGINYMAHRIAWLHYYGHWPTQFVDHKDGVKSNNAITNLREASNSQNKCNMGKRTDNSTGFKGVYFNKLNSNYRAGICINGQKISLGSFSTPEEAHAAYCKAALELHGTFSRSS